MAEQKDQKAVVYAYFNEPYPLRAFVSFLRTACTRANLVFSKTKIILKQENAESTVLTYLDINTSLLPEYEYEPYDDEGKLIPEICAGVDTAELLKCIKLVQKTDTLKLFILPGSARLYVTIISGGSNARGKESPVYIIPIIEVPIDCYSEIIYDRKEDDPNTKIETPVFSKLCSSFQTLKCNHVVVNGYKKGITFKGILNTGEVGMLQPYGEIDNEQPKPKPDDNIMKLLSSLTLTSKNITGGQPIKLTIVNRDASIIKVKTSIFKSMSKFSNMSGKGLVMIYIQPDRPLKLITRVGNYGKLTVYLKNDTKL